MDTKRFPKVSLSDLPLAHPRMNAIAKRHQKAFERAVTEFILPEGNAQFLPPEAPLYVFRRNWKMEPDFEPALHDGLRHEKKLHSLFWDPEHSVIQLFEGEPG